MNALILLATLVCSADTLDDGTLLFLENANSVVKVATGGKIGHVAIVMTEEGQPWIYEATPARVRRVTPEAYYEELARINARREDDEKKIRMLAAAPKTLKWKFREKIGTKMKWYMDVEETGQIY